MYREPNKPGSVDEKQKSETELLLAELAYSPMFKVFLQRCVVPRVTDVRAKLLRDSELNEDERRGLVYYLLELEKMVMQVFAATEAEAPPDWLRNIFH